MYLCANFVKSRQVGHSRMPLLVVIPILDARDEEYLYFTPPDATVQVDGENEFLQTLEVHFLDYKSESIKLMDSSAVVHIALSFRKGVLTINWRECLEQLSFPFNRTGDMIQEEELLYLHNSIKGGKMCTFQIA